MSAFEVLALNTSIPQIQAAQAGDSYVMVVNATTPALRITQTGTGDSILVEDAANPDSSPFVVTAGGDVGIGATTPAYKLDVQGGLARSQNSGGINNGYLITTNSSNAAARNWAVLSNSNAFGDFVIRQGNSLGSDPVSGTDRLVIDASGNLGLGVTPSGWSSSVAAQVGYGAALSSRAAGNTASDMTHGAYWNGTNWLHQYSSVGAGRYQMTGANAGSTHAWFVSAGGTANNTISFTQAMTLDASGNLLVNRTNVLTNSKVSVDGSLGLNAPTGSAGVLRLYDDGTQYGGIASAAWAFGGGASQTDLTILATNNLIFGTNNTTERARITSGGYFKASNTGTYANSTGTYHELRSSTSDARTVIIANTASSLPFGILVDYTGAAPNGTGNAFLECQDTGGARFVARSNGGLANYQSNNVDLSDARTKADINPLGSYWSKIAGLEIVTYKYKDQTHDDLNIGVIAQQVEAVAPEFVDSDGFGDTPEDGVPLKTIYNKDLTFAAIKALQEAMARIETLEAKIAALEAK